MTVIEQRTMESVQSGMSNLDDIARILNRIAVSFEEQNELIAKQNVMLKSLMEGMNDEKMA